MPEESKNDSSVGRMKRFAQHVDDALYRFLDQRVSRILLAVAVVEALVAPFRGTRWAVFSLTTTAVAIGLTWSAAYLWIQCIGNAAWKISQFYEQEVRGAATPQGKAAPEKPLPRWRN